MSIEQKHCPLTNSPCQTPHLCDPPIFCDDERTVQEIVGGFTDITRLALAGKMEQAQHRLNTDRIWFQSKHDHHHNVDAAMKAARKIIFGS